MKHYTFAFLVCALLGCPSNNPGRPGPGGQDMKVEPNTEMHADEDAGTPDPVVEEDAGMPEPTPPPPPKERPPRKPKPEPEIPDAGVETDAQVDAGHDAGPDGGPPSVEVDPTPSGTLRDLTMHLTGMEDHLHQFAQFRVVNEAREFHIMFVIHEGMTSADYTWQLKNALVAGESYTLDFFIDHDDRTGIAFYDVPPIDHAWSLDIPAGDGDVEITFPFNTHYTDIESIAPEPFHSTIVANTGMSEYIGALYDVRVIERASGLLVGRQMREIPGDSFDVTVGSTTHEGVEYQVDIAIDTDADGDYEGEPSWRLIGTGTATGLHLALDSAAPQLDVGF